MPSVILRTLFVTLGCVLAANANTTPNVILYYADDMGWTDWEMNGGPYGSGYYETPNLNMLAQQGLTFNNAYSASSVCTASRASLLTGQGTARHRMTNIINGGNHPSNLTQPNWVQNLPESRTTLGEVMQDAGYATANIGKWHVGSTATGRAPLQHGFDVSIAPDVSILFQEAGHFAGPDGQWLTPGLNTPGMYPADAYLADVLTDKSIDFIDESIGNVEPFFLQFSQYSPHTPLQAPQDLVDYYTAKPRAGGHTNPKFAAMLHNFDANLGRLLDKLDTEGIRDNTIIIFASDNGGQHFSTANDPLRSWKGSTYEGGIRTPLVVSWTGNEAISQNTTTETLAIGYDLYPTILDLTGVTADPGHEMDGVSLAEAIETGSQDRGPVFFHYPHITHPGHQVEGGAFNSALRDGDYKLIYFYETETWELYDVAADLGETTNLYESEPGIALELGYTLADWLQDVDALMPIDLATGEPVPLPRVVLPNGDFNDDGTYDCLDIDDLVANIAAGQDSLLFDLSGDRLVNRTDLEAWLSQAAGTGSTFLPGDANLDGQVDGQDFLEWNANKFTLTPAWCSGDFNADGVVNGADFILWNTNKFEPPLDIVPEPTFLYLYILLATAVWPNIRIGAKREAKRF